MLDAQLDLEEHAAREMGQWKDKAEISGVGKDGVIPVVILPAIVPTKEEDIQEMALPPVKKR